MKTLLISSSFAILILMGGCCLINPDPPFEDISGIERAVKDMENVYSQVSTLKAVANKSDKAKALLNDKEIIVKYGRASAFLNSYWRNSAGKLVSTKKLNRSEGAYLADPDRAAVTNFIALVEKKLSNIPEKETGIEVFIAEQVIRVIEFFVKRRDEVLQRYRYDFKQYLDSLRMTSWPADFKMPEQPEAVKKNP